jgi:hypothetical protein
MGIHKWNQTFMYIGFSTALHLQYGLGWEFINLKRKVEEEV